ncbi:MAG: hypothetical protein LBU14_00740 [Candidatus Peribacteria bacterium]|nr:hypothetical protein [Candidatus Peribacteria bacterium]
MDKLAQEKERIEKTPEDMRTPDQMDRLKKINKEMNDLKTENEKLDKEFTEEQAKKVEIENKIPPLIKKAKDFLNKNDEKFINDERKSIEAIIRDLEDVTSDKDKENLIGKLEELMKTIQERINAKPATPESVKKLLTDSNLDITTITDELELEKVIKTIEEYNKLGDEDKKLINIDINKLKEVEKVSEMIKKLKGNSLFTNALASKLIPAFLSLKNMKEVDISIDKDVVIQIKGDESKYYREAVRIMK